MYSHYQDALAITRVYGNPQYFITFTCNVGWDEIKGFMLSHNVAQAQDRPDIIARIFRLKVLEFISFLKSDKVFGDVSAYLYTIEFQKRGLPHCHTLLWVTNSYRIKTPEKVDKYISAELPDPENEKDLFETVTGCMFHGPCGFSNLQAPCTRDGICKKGFPKPFNTKTFFDKDCYVHYKRREMFLFTTPSGVQIHNGFVVPYNKRLCSRFKAHINVEYCGWNMMIKYLFKYISKGADPVSYTIEVNTNNSQSGSSRQETGCSSTSRIANDAVDEVQQFLDGRFICPHEAAWRILNFPIHQRHPSVQILSVHLEGMQSSTFRDDDDLETIASSPNFGRTTLTRWLASNSVNCAGAHLIYADYPSLFTWDTKNKDWIRRSINTTPAIGRLVYVHPSSGELFYLRMLLCHQVGCSSFQDIRIVKSITYPSYRLACEAMGITGDDKEWLSAFLEASLWASASQLRTLFCHLLIFCEVANPQELWAAAWEKMGDDIRRSFSSATVFTSSSLTDDRLQDCILLELENTLNGCTPSKSLKDFQLPMPSTNYIPILANRLLLEETSYDRERLCSYHLHMSSKLNMYQRNVYDRVVQDFEEGKQTLLFVYGHGGTGKTFLWSTILAYFRSNGQIILAIAASGIASLLLPGGTFKAEHSYRAHKYFGLQH